MAPSASPQNPKSAANGTSEGNSKAPDGHTQDSKVNGANGRTHPDEPKSGRSPGESLEELCVVLQRAHNLPGFKNLVSLLEENESLRQRLDEEEKHRKVQVRDSRQEAMKLEKTEEDLKKSRNDTNKLEEKLQTVIKDSRETLTAVQGRLRAAESREKEVDSLYQGKLEELCAKDAKIHKAENEKNQAIKRESDLKKTIANLEARVAVMTDAQTELATLRSFGAVTEKMGQNTALHTNSLKSLFDITSKALQDLVFKHEMDFADGAVDEWRNYKLHGYVKLLNIPLPASNSLLAKQMRFASALAVLSHILVDRMFRPIYISSGQDWINSILRAMDDKGATKREHHVRSILLNIDPEAQLQVGRQLAQAACDEAVDVLKLIVDPRDQEKLRDRLKNICNDGLELWMKLQRVEEHIVPDLEIGAVDEWEPLTLPAEALAGSSSRNPVTSSERSRASRVSEAPAGGASPSQRAEDLAGPEVWPAFTFNEGVLTHGYYLRHKQVVDAKNEERAAEDEASSRSMKRLSRLRGTSVSGKKPILKPFLLQGRS